MSEPTAAAVRSGPPPVNCAGCGLHLLAAWDFRRDDKFCGLCGVKVLHLRVRHADPSGAVWLYSQAGEPILVSAIWFFGQKPPWQRSLPEMDPSRCKAWFRDGIGNNLTFDLADAGTEGQWQKLQLVPRFKGFESLKLPPSGYSGFLTLATTTGEEIRTAFLLPFEKKLLQWRCTDPSIKKDSQGTWLLYRKDKVVELPFRLEAPVRVCILKGKPSSTGPDFTIVGFDKPVIVEPGKPYDFTLKVNNNNWTPKEVMPFQFDWTTTAGRSVVFKGQMALVEGRRLKIDGIDLREQVRFGEVFTTNFALRASNGDGIEEEGIEIRRLRVSRISPQGDWLRVLQPTEENLPLLIPPCVDDSQDMRVLSLQVDTTRLDRSTLNNHFLKAHIDLFDSRDRTWTCDLHVTATRSQPLDQFLAIDWGTTNTCAAYSIGVGEQAKPPTPVLFDRDHPNPEQFPSDIYFVDLSDPEKPDFSIGFKAVERGSRNPECLLRSVKRKFQFREKVTVMDERQRTHVYPVEVIVRLLLHRLINQAEVTQKQEFHGFGLTFPTKWSPRVRQRLEKVTRELQSRLAAERQGPTVEVLPPRIDEANAVALHLLTTGAAGRDLPDHFHLVSYDFGGGTVDTCVLEVSLDGQLSTRYVGTGGRPDFGGDDVTRAVMMLLHERLVAALAQRESAAGQPPKEATIPLISDGESLKEPTTQEVFWYRVGRTNWDVLWKVAEEIKQELCNSRTAEAGAAAVEASPIRKLIQTQRTKIRCRLDGQDKPESLDRLQGVLSNEQRNRFYDALEFTLDEASDHPLVDIDNVNRGQQFTVRERVEDSIKELRWQLDDASAVQKRPIEPEIIILAGGGSRLPLVAELMRRYFPTTNGRDDRIVFQTDIAKQRVAHGMANYLSSYKAEPSFVEGLAKSVDVTHHHLGFQRVRRQRAGFGLEFVVIVRAGTKIHDPDVWHPLTFGANQHGDGTRLTLYIQNWRHGPRAFGYFDLGRPLTSESSTANGWLGEPCPVVPGTAYDGDLRLYCTTQTDGVLLQQVELRVRHQGKCYGPYALVTTLADADSALHV